MRYSYHFHQPPQAWEMDVSMLEDHPFFAHHHPPRYEDLFVMKHGKCFKGKMHKGGKGLGSVVVVAVEVVEDAIMVLMVTILITTRMHLDLLVIMAVGNSTPIPMDIDMDMTLTMSMSLNTDSTRGLNMADPDPATPADLASTTLTTNTVVQVPTSTLGENSTIKAVEAPDMNGAQERSMEKERVSIILTTCTICTTYVFVTTAQTVIHASLPGAQKSDLSVGYDASRSLLRIAGIVHRPGVDEEMYQALLVGERGRHLGVFEREVPLSHSVVVAGIQARLEDGLLKVVLPRAEGEEVQHGNEVEVEMVNAEKELSTPDESDTEGEEEEEHEDEGEEAEKEFVKVDIQ
ncbi:hypothetical protein P875_00138358 [Aspergillus parasiticus SU-1]|uniref:SHSP domain-containing protein n=1 Tax=Aspergillus parasiticus (strain ATCC 56775 / NRRL 5862 / SRRC 143 / SU-1) TaxID=1403190 RepID=A0A0F0IBW9_ASPPU|nr:hypothetical protein P875_00138358 [Aspergillus parasiticus SU-1]